MSSIIEHLAGLETAGEFVKSISCSPRIFRGAGVNFKNVVTLEEFDRIITINGLRPPFISLINGKTGLRSSNYNIYYEQATQCGNSGKIFAECIKNGTTVIVQHAHLLFPRVRALVADLARSLNPISIQTNCYLTPHSSQGVFPHIDQHHTLLLQLSGSKRWCVWENIDEDPNSPMVNPHMSNNKPAMIAASTAPVIDDWVNEGDFILIPRGFVHTPFTGETHSLHLTFGLIDPGLATASELFFRTIVSDYTNETEREKLNNGRFAIHGAMPNFVKPTEFIQIL